MAGLALKSGLSPLARVLFPAMHAGAVEHFLGSTTLSGLAKHAIGRCWSGPSSLAHFCPVCSSALA